jgi:hypothetical protein
VDLALVMSGDLDGDLLRGYIEDRIRALRSQAAAYAHHGERVWPDQTVADDLVAEHARLRIEAELSWHQLLLDQAGKLTEATADSSMADSAAKSGMAGSVADSGMARSAAAGEAM